MRAVKPRSRSALRRRGLFPNVLFPELTDQPHTPALHQVHHGLDHLTLAASHRELRDEIEERDPARPTSPVRATSGL